MDTKAFGAGSRGQAVHFHKVWVYQTGVPLRCSCCVLDKMASVALCGPCDRTQQHSPLERPSLWRLQALGVVSAGPTCPVHTGRPGNASPCASSVTLHSWAPLGGCCFTSGR